MSLALTILLAGCAEEPKPGDTGDAATPYGMVLAEDGQLYAGVARVDVTPEGFETYTDLNGNHSFDGCYTDPAAERTGCDEPYDDLNGDNHFDAVWIAGFGSSRAAMGVHDPITVTAVVLSLDGEYVALVGVDALGVLENRVRDARDLLAADGFDRDRIVVSSSHTHQGPDTAGIYGIEDQLISGTYAPFMESLAPAIRDAVQAAAGEMVAVAPRQGVTTMSADTTLNGAPFGGSNPNDRVLGGINDIRDPVVAADQVFAMAFEDTAGNRVATVIDASGHPETVGSDNDLLSADYPHFTRDWIERRSGGLAVFLSGALGGMQSALGAALPTVDEAGERVVDGTTGDPVWDTTGEGWAFAETWGVLVAQAAEAALTDTTPWTSIRVRTAEALIPVDNISFKLAFQLSLLDTPDEYVVQDASCPGWGDPDLFGCVPAGIWVLELGPNTLASFPGELMPEIFWGVPDEPAMADAALRDGDPRWVQSDPDCAQVDWETCRNEVAVGDCDCLHHHAAPYTISADGAPPVADLLPGTFKAPIGIANAYCGYIVPEPDFSTYVSVLTEDGDHYEETNSCSRQFAPILQDAYRALLE